MIFGMCNIWIILRNVTYLYSKIRIFITVKVAAMMSLDEFLDQKTSKQNKFAFYLMKSYLVSDKYFDSGHIQGVPKKPKTIEITNNNLIVRI
jgi:hypothetical protein